MIKNLPNKFKGFSINSFFILLIATLLLLLLLTSFLENDDQTSSLDEYCSKVITFRDTKGKYGWPDYKGLISTCETTHNSGV